MRRLVSLFGCTALLGGGLTVAATTAANAGLQPATMTATAEFVCSDESVTVNWTLTVSDTPDGGGPSDITSANASPAFGAVTFTPATDLEDGDVSTGSSTHPPDTTDVALSVEFETGIPGAVAEGETTLETPVECPPEEPPPPPVVEDPPVVAPDFTG